MERRFLVFLVCSAIIYSGCAMEPEVSNTTTAPTSTAVGSDSSRSATGLPHAHGPLGRSHRAMRVVAELFRTVEPLKRAQRLTVAELQPIPINARYSPVLVSKCDLEALKALVASDWIPVVVTRSPVGPKHVRAVVGYDDASEHIILTDPVNYAEARIKYSDFSSQWDDPRKSCLVLLSRPGSANGIKGVLRRYLSEEKADSIIIKTSRKQ